MNIDSIINGIVIDHITAGKAMQIYTKLNLDALDCQVAIIKNASSNKNGRKDIIKIADEIDIDLGALAVICPTATVNIIRDSKVIEKRALKLPERIENVMRCKNPRCITTTEQEIRHIFILTNPETAEYRCMYCDTKANN
ncbi:MAG: aspartate carbamoyltransferase regulatory subunit [Clostridia bacterium]|nr:aspartate carbamoyltransferase regulatory subunit [Clostridia bacterium]